MLFPIIVEIPLVTPVVIVGKNVYPIVPNAIKEATYLLVSIKAKSK